MVGHQILRSEPTTNTKSKNYLQSYEPKALKAKKKRCIFRLSNSKEADDM